MTFCPICCFSLSEHFSKAIGPFLTHPGPRNLPVGSHQISFGYLLRGRRLFGAKNCSHDFFMRLIVIMFCAGFTIFFPLCFPSKILIIFLLWPFFLQLHLVLIFLLFLREYFGNQASLTNCTGTLIRLTDSTASAPPVRRNKGSFQRVSFFTIHMS